VDRDNFESFARGVPLPSFTAKEIIDWFDMIKGFHARGVKFQRLRLMPDTINPYLRYEIEWGYTNFQALGEEFRFHPLSATNRTFHKDFYIVDNSIVVHLEYGDGGTWGGFFLEKDPLYAKELIDGALALWNNATSLEEFLASYRSKAL